MKTSKLLDAHENMGDKVRIVFGFASDWLRGYSSVSFLDQSPSKVKRHQSNPESLSTFHQKQVH